MVEAKISIESITNNEKLKSDKRKPTYAKAPVGESLFRDFCGRSPQKSLQRPKAEREGLATLIP